MRIVGRLAAVPAALAMLLPPVPAGAAGHAAPAPRNVVVTGDDACPGGRTEDILVCGMLAMGPKQLKILHDMTRCLADLRPAAARKALADGYDAGDRVAFRNIADSGAACGLRGQLHVSGLLFAGGTEAEGAVVETMLPQLSNCLGRGIRLVTNRPALRAMLALAALRLAINNKG